MIRIAVSCDQSGLICKLTSSGHASGMVGKESLACGIVSSALRSFGRVVGQKPGVALSGSVSRPGSFEMTTSDISADSRDWYRGAGEVLIQELRDVQTDFPDRIDLKIHII